MTTDFMNCLRKQKSFFFWELIESLKVRLQEKIE